MKIIRIEANPSGSRPPIQDWNGGSLPDGYAYCPEEFVELFYSTNPAGFVNIEVVDGTVSAMTINQEAFDAYIASLPTPQELTPSEKREEAYNTEKIIEWDGEMITVTEASQLWQYYSAEGNTEKSSMLTALIAEAKETIRAKYPDVE